ncbi:MAG: hypothetical protein MI924_27730 [Chloroflexales bacterium]|nr:hypothetical protein [Chloroflexales bacterium]
MKPQDYLTDTKITVLLNTLDFQLNEIQRQQDHEQQIFQWAMSFLLTLFGAIMALFGVTTTTQFPVIIKILASVIVVFPIVFSMYWIFRLSAQAVNNAIAAERIQSFLLLFHPNYYGPEALYPQEWRGNLAKDIRKRRTPLYYAITMVMMTACLEISIWTLL